MAEFFFILFGRVTERPNVPDSKSGVGATRPGVQIPPLPFLTAYCKTVFLKFAKTPKRMTGACVMK